MTEQMWIDEIVKMVEQFAQQHGDETLLYQADALRKTACKEVHSSSLELTHDFSKGRFLDA